MSAPEELVIPTRVARFDFDDHLFCGQRAFGELAGNSSMAGTFLLALTGRRASADDCALIDDLMACCAMADPRIWPLKVTRIVGSYGSFQPAMLAGQLSTDAALAGPSTVGRAIEQLRELVRLSAGQVGDREAVRRAFEELRRHTPELGGFGVPFRERDERVEAFREHVRARGRDQRTHWMLFETLLGILRAGEKKLELNIVSAMAAVALDLDLGFEPELGQMFGALLLSPCFYANAREASIEPAPLLRELPDACVAYAGRVRRKSPLAERLR